jgi:hypothetical protein
MKDNNINKVNPSKDLNKDKSQKSPSKSGQFDKQHKFEERRPGQDQSKRDLNRGEDHGKY